MAYHKVHCPRCGKIINANELAFDFGEIINIALEKAKTRMFGNTEEWYFLTNFKLCLYLTAEELQKDYGLKSMPDHTYQGFFEFKVKHLIAHLVKLANSMNKDFSIDVLIQNDNAVEYNALTEAMAKSQDVNRKELAEQIQELAQMLKKNPDETVITRFFVTVRMDQDDRGNWFANRLLIKFDDGKEEKNFTTFVCKGEQGSPCGRILYGQAGKYKEIVIGMAGTARVGKTAYLAALLACILRKGNNLTGKLGFPQHIIVPNAYVAEEFSVFDEVLLKPYSVSKKIPKTNSFFEDIGKGKEAAALFSMTFTINRNGTGKSYIFTFIDMPGEVYDDSHNEGVDAIWKSRRIIKDADMIWTCISVEQIREEAQPGTDHVNTEWQKAITNLGKTMNAIGRGGSMPTAVLVTKSDIANQLYVKDFNPFASAGNPMKYLEEKDESSPWISEDGNLYFSNMEWFLQKTLDYMNTAPGLSESIRNIFGAFTPFAVAPYGRNIENIMELNAMLNSLPVPSMIEGPFLWTLGALGLLDVYKEQYVMEEHTEGWGPFKKTVSENILKNVKVDQDHLEKLYFFSNK